MPYFINNPPYLIAQGDNALIWLRMRYELIPNAKLANVGYDFSISTKPYFEGLNLDFLTFIVTPKEWEEYVISKGFKLLYIFHADENFITTYGQFFPNGVQDDMCYYVQNHDGGLILVPVID